MTKSIKKTLLILSVFSISTISTALLENTRYLKPHFISANIVYFYRDFAKNSKIDIKNTAQYMNTTQGAGGGEVFLKEGSKKAPVAIYLGSWITPIKDRITEKNAYLSNYGTQYLIMIEMKQYKGTYYATFTVGNADESFYLEKYIVSWTPSTRKNPSQEKSIPCEATPLTSGLVRISNQGEWLQGVANKDGKVLLVLK